MLSNLSCLLDLAALLQSIFSLKLVVFGIMEGNNKRVRPHRDWTDDVEDWCGEPLQNLFHLAQDKYGWRKRIKLALDTYEHTAPGD
jgi:hypothetical protein